MDSLSVNQSYNIFPTFSNIQYPHTSYIGTDLYYNLHNPRPEKSYRVSGVSVLCMFFFEVSFMTALQSFGLLPVYVFSFVKVVAIFDGLL